MELTDGDLQDGGGLTVSSLALADQLSKKGLSELNPEGPKHPRCTISFEEAGKMEAEACCATSS